MTGLLADLWAFVLWLDYHVVDLTLALRQPLLTKLMTSVTGLGSATAALVFLGVCYLADWTDELRSAALALALTGAVVGTLMLTVARPFPPGPVCMTSGAETVATSFPSGHAAAVTVFAMTARRSSVLPFGPVAVLAALIAVSRVYLGTHFFSDTVVGVLIGVAAFAAAVHIRTRFDLDARFGLAADRR
jgi:membrane-associated phospholipid phosphatase